MPNQTRCREVTSVVTSRSVAVYALADPATIGDAASEIAKVLQRASGGSGDDGELEVDPNTGILRFRRPALLNSTEGDLGNPESAERAAQRFLDAVRDGSASLRSGDGGTLPSILPSSVRTTGLSIGTDSTGVPACWIVRFTPLISPGLAPQSGLVATVAEPLEKNTDAGHHTGATAPLPLKGGGLPIVSMPVVGIPIVRRVRPPAAPLSPELPVAKPVEVVNAVIDVRVTGHGDIGGLTSRWRPLATNRVITTALFDRPEQEDESDSKPMIGYLVASDGDPQRFLAPYFLWQGHAGLVAAPASGYSLTALIVPAGDDEFRVLVGGNSAGGQLRFAWAAYNLSEPDDGIYGLGHEDRVRLEPGTYNLIVDVMDVSTGAICRTESIAPIYPLDVLHMLGSGQNSGS